MRSRRPSLRYHQPEWLITQTMNQSRTLGGFLDSLLRQAGLSNRTVAFEAGVSESVIRNLLRYGVNPAAKDPDPRTLRAVADCLGVEPLHLFRLAGYIDENPSTRSVQAEHLAAVFDSLLPEYQQILWGMFEVLLGQVRQHQDTETAAVIERGQEI